MATQKLTKQILPPITCDWLNRYARPIFHPTLDSKFETMKPGPQPQQDQSYYMPPPGYSPPGQEPPSSQTCDSNFATAPPPPGIHANRQQPQPMIIYTNTTVAPAQFGPYPMRYTCPNCNAHVMTETHSTPGLLTYILSGALCFLAGYLLCCLVPCCVRECKDIEHRCPNCQHKLGLFKRI